MPDVQTLRVFVAVAEKLSLTRAAEGLLLSQSAVSHQIAKLEAEMQAELLERRGRTVVLTRAGEHLRREAIDVLGRIDGLAAGVRTIADPEHGSLRIGATATACQYLLPDPIREFRECFPGYALNVLPGDTAVLADALQARQIDIAVLILDASARRLPHQPLLTDQLGLIFPPQHPLRQKARLAAVDLAGQHWVMYSRSSVTGRLIERHFAKMRIDVGQPIELGSIEAIKELVKVGLGLGVQAKWAVRGELAEGSLDWRPLPGPPLLREWAIARSADRPFSLAEETFVQLCRAAIRGLQNDVGATRRTNSNPA